MELFIKFKKDYLNYLISIILPAVISGISIPLFKYLLGPEGYGKFALWFNAILILSTVLTGWIAQSILRLFPASNDKMDLSKRCLKLSLNTQLVFLVPIGTAAWLIGNDVVLALLSVLTLFSISMQFTVLPIIQSSFLSRKIIFSELLRIIIYVGGGAILLAFTNLYYLYSLLIAAITSYSSSYFYLKRCMEKSTAEIEQINSVYSRQNISNHELVKKIYHYGVPLSIWFVFSYLMTYVDKLFTLHLFGGHIQGNYQAIFDLINKSLVLIISPVITSVFPLLTDAYETGKRPQIRTLIKKIFLYEIVAFMVISIGYWVIGARILLYILGTPYEPLYIGMGFIIICATFIWQFNILAQKRFELKLRSKVLLAVVIIAFLCQILFYYVFRNSSNQLIAPLGYLVSSIVYLIIIAVPEIKLILTKKKDGIA